LEGFEGWGGVCGEKKRIRRKKKDVYWRGKRVVVLRSTPTRIKAGNTTKRIGKRQKHSDRGGGLEGERNPPFGRSEIKPPTLHIKKKKLANISNEREEPGLKVREGTLRRNIVSSKRSWREYFYLGDMQLLRMRNLKEHLS